MSINTGKIAGLLRQIDQINKTTYMTDQAKAASIDQIRQDIDKETGQATLALATSTGGPEAASASTKAAKGV